VKKRYFKLHYDMLEWEPLYRTNGCFDQYGKYVNWWNPISKKYRYWGYQTMTYDAQKHQSFGFWFFNVGWSF